MVRIRFAHADAGYQAPDAFIAQLTRHVSGEDVHIVADPKITCDIEFASVQYPMATRMRTQGTKLARELFPQLQSRDARWSTHNPVPRGLARSHIWFTGENLRPPVGDWTGYLSFDLDPLDGRNAYCPLWWWNIGLMGTARSPFMEPAPRLDDLMTEREPDCERRGFVALIMNNPHPMRLHAANALRKYGNVDTFGRAVGRPVPSKSDIARNYRFVLCFENDLYPGYVTEKAVEAWACGAIPLWWGSDPAGYFNPQALVNAADYPSLEAVASEVDRINRDQNAWRTMASQRLVVREPDLEPAKLLIRKALEL